MYIVTLPMFKKRPRNHHEHKLQKNHLTNKKHFYFTGGVTMFQRHERHMLQLDDVGIISTTTADEAYQMSKLIADLPGLCPADLGRRPNITDGCAGCGGNAISFTFSGLYQNVSAIEVDSKRANLLTHNINMTKSIRLCDTNIKIICASYTDVMTTINQDVVFLDPPWGGKSYKEVKELSITLDKYTLDEIVIRLHEQCAISGLKYIVLKIPFNFDLDDMKSKIDTHMPSKVNVLHRFPMFNLLYIKI